MLHFRTVSAGLTSHPTIQIRVANDKSYNAVELYGPLLSALGPLSEAAKALRVLLLKPNQ